jgi:molybdate transport system substrate-binding protein
MISKSIYIFSAICIAMIAMAMGSANAADLKVLSDGPLQPALVKIGEAFQRDRGSTVAFVFGTSPVIHKKVTDGEAADVLIIQPNFVDELVKAGKVVAGDHPVIARVGIGLAVRADAPTRDVSTPEALKQALLSADSLVFNNVASGNYFATVLERLGIADSIKAKIARTNPPEVFALVMQGKGNDIGIGTVPQIIAEKGLKLIGPLPPTLQNHLVYAAAPMTATRAPELAKEFIRFLASQASKARFDAAGMN